eukprot:TRINITY_DN43059_c0_g1_i1.p1 TRINITY_DN43059_c0_g1~~TRINITY_DN43059_c0_g1_i1.p1  ORF type:complete len:264 (+),score=40.04 TRINITY_DN43059_c0_g1_i1:54-794(+)
MATPVGCLDSGRCVLGYAGGSAPRGCPLVGSRVLTAPQDIFSLADADGSVQALDQRALEALMGCNYARHLLFETEDDLKGVDLWAFPPPVSPATPFGCLPSSQELGCAALIQDGRFLSDELRIRPLGGAGLGFGLFATKPILQGAFIGEYTGVVRRRGPGDTDHSGYILPILDPDLVIASVEYGNACRLMGHSSDVWNVDLLTAHHDGLPHVICQADRDIRPGEQLILRSGTRCWSNVEQSRPSSL